MAKMAAASDRAGITLSRCAPEKPDKGAGESFGGAAARAPAAPRPPPPPASRPSSRRLRDTGEPLRRPPPPPPPPPSSSSSTPPPPPPGPISTLHAAPGAARPLSPPRGGPLPPPTAGSAPRARQSLGGRSASPSSIPRRSGPPPSLPTRSVGGALSSFRGGVDSSRLGSPGHDDETHDDDPYAATPLSPPPLKEGAAEPSLVDRVERLQAELDAVLEAQRREEGGLRYRGRMERLDKAGNDVPSVIFRGRSTRSVSGSGSGSGSGIPGSESLSSDTHPKEGEEEQEQRRRRRRRQQRSRASREDRNDIGDVNPVLVMLNVLIAVLAAVLGASGAYFVSHYRHNDLVMDTHRTLETLKRYKVGGFYSSSDTGNDDQSVKGMSGGRKARMPATKAPSSMQRYYKKAAPAPAPKKSEEEKKGGWGLLRFFIWSPSDDAKESKEEKEKEKARAKKAQDMAEYVRNMEYQKAVKRFGDGPHRIKFTISFPAIEGGNVVVKAQERTFYVETVPLRYMPHTVSTFLSMVEEGSYDGVRFNDITSEGNPTVDFNRRLVPAAGDASVADRFRRALENGGATEYVESPPRADAEVDGGEVTASTHGKGTVGFLGRGPGFIINRNAENAAKMMSIKKYAVFGRVVEGFSAVQKLSAMGAGVLKRQPVEVLSIKIVTG